MPDPKPTHPSPSCFNAFSSSIWAVRGPSVRAPSRLRDTFRLLLNFAEAKIGKAPTRLALADLDAQLILSFSTIWRRNGAMARAAATLDWQRFALS